MKRRYTLQVTDHETGKVSTTEADSLLTFAAERSLFDLIQEVRDRGGKSIAPSVEINMHNLSTGDILLMRDLFMGRIDELSETIPEMMMPLEKLISDSFGDQAQARVESVLVEERAHDDEVSDGQTLVSRLMRH